MLNTLLNYSSKKSWFRKYHKITKIEMMLIWGIKEQNTGVKLKRSYVLRRFLNTKNQFHKEKT